eukprot:gb/GECG01005342.1/.p1 GENE.gb/GECG01005342.1/~~gb/GECG01005342.1/.p1  ORF type:complete len:378 (+),score=63.06 gb/GECG01005342.1/:1-1134(+)
MHTMSSPDRYQRASHDDFVADEGHSSEDEHSSGGRGRQGRARSASFHSSEEGLAEIDQLNASDESDTSVSVSSGDNSPGTKTKETEKSPTKGEQQTGGSASSRRHSPTGGHPVSSRTKEVLTHLPKDDLSYYIGGNTYEAMKHLEQEEGENRELEKQEKEKQKVKKVVKRRPGKTTEQPHFDLHIKLLLLGDQGVGKTSLMLRYAEDKFQNSMMPTMGVDYKTQYMDVENQQVKCQIWDTAGQKNFHVITQAYYRGAHGIVLVYDVSDPEEKSFKNVKYWMDNIHQHSTPNTYKVLVGNKVDSKHRQVSTERGAAAAKEYDMPFFETSAKDGTNVVDTFHTLAAQIVKRINKAEASSPDKKPPTKAVKKSGSNCTVQ